MICIYDSKCIDFNNNGLVVLSDAISCTITEELNGMYECIIEYPLDTRGKWQRLIEGNIVKADDQLFRIYHKVKNLTSLTCNARHITYDLLDNLLEDCRPTNLSGAGALDWILTHTQFSHPFTSMGDVGGSNTRYFVRKNPIEAIFGADGVIATWGGEISRTGFEFHLLNSRGQDRGVLIAYGKNIVGIEETLDLDGICTRLMPIGSDGLLLPEKYIDSPYIANFPHPKIKVQEFSDIGIDEDSGITEEIAINNLRSAATKYMTDNKIDIPQFNYTVDFVELSKTEEYKHYAILETVYLGDTVAIKHSKLNINLKAKVIKITKNCITNRIENIELGSFKPNLATSISNSIQAVQTDISNAKSSLQTAIDNATTQINSALGGYVVKRNGELLIMDTEDINTATKIWRWNKNGLGYATSYNGEYRTAITADGHIVADFMDTGTLDAEKITVNGLTVGKNVTMGADAKISWANVTSQPSIPNGTNIDANGNYTGGVDYSTQVSNKPTIPSQYTDTLAIAAWKSSNYATNITDVGVYTGNVVATNIKGGTLKLGGADIATDGKFELYNKDGVLILDSDNLTPLATELELAIKGDKTYNVNDFAYTINANELKTFTIPLDKSTYKYGQALIYSYADTSGLSNDNATLLQIGLEFCKNALRTQSIVTPSAEKFYANSFVEQRLKSSSLSYLGYLSLQGGLDYANRWTTGTVLIDFYLDNDKIKFTVLNQTGASVTGAMRVQSQVW